MTRPDVSENFFNAPTSEEIALPPPKLAVVNGTPVTKPQPLQAVTASDVLMRSIEWVEKPLVQGSAFTLLVGPKGCGKGTWIAKTAAKMTRDVYGAPRRVLFVSSEDSAAIDTVPRLNAAGADLEMVEIVTEHITLPHDLERLRTFALEIENVGLIVVDPIGNHMGGGDTDKEGIVRNAISGLNRLADELACTVFGVRHLGKNRQNGALSAVLGSVAWVDLPRQVNVFSPDDADDMTFHVHVQAGNRSAHGAGESFRIELRNVEGVSEPVTYCAELGASHKDPDELLAAPKRSSKSQTARDLILDILEGDGDQESDALDARVARETSLSAGTVKNQRVALKDQGLIRNVPVRDDDGSVKRWKVARTEAPRP